MEEIWKPVRGFEKYAEISNYGQIHRFERVYYSGKNHQIKKVQEETFTYGYETLDGYLEASIGGVTKGVHQWVYMTFVGDIPKSYDVNHLDENKYNNRLDNLNLLSHGDNIRYGTGVARRSDALKGKPKSPEHIAKIAASKSKAVQALNPKTLEVVMEFASTAEAGRQGFNASAVSACCRNCFNRPGNNVYKGYIWRYAVQ